MEETRSWHWGQIRNRIGPLDIYSYTLYVVLRMLAFREHPFWMNSSGWRGKKPNKDDTCYLKRQHLSVDLMMLQDVINL